MAAKIGFIGLGAMGFPIARNLLDSGFSLRVYNRTREKASPLAALGAEVVASPAQAVESGLMVTMVSDDRAVEDLVMGDGGAVAKSLGSGGVHISMSTIAPATARRLAAFHGRHGSAYVAAPVFGRPEAAAGRKLVVCTSGPDAAKQRVRSALDAIGQAVFDFGTDPGAANVVKLAGNFLIASAMESIAEALTIAERNGISRVDVARMFAQTLFACPIYQTYGRNVAEERFEPGFRLTLGLKDIGVVLATAAESQSPMPIASLLHDRLLASVAKGRGDLDWSAVALQALDDAGIARPDVRQSADASN